MGKTLGKLLAGQPSARSRSRLWRTPVTASIVGAENTATFDNNPIGAMSGNSFVCDWAYRGAMPVHGYRRGGR